MRSSSNTRVSRALLGFVLVGGRCCCALCVASLHARARRLLTESVAQVGLLSQNQAEGLFEANTISNNRAVNVMMLGHSNCTLVKNIISDSPGGGVLLRGDCKSTLRLNTMQGNSRANTAVLDNARPVLEENVIQDGSGRGLVVTGTSAGHYVGNIVRSHSLAGVYVGGSAEPHMLRNIVCESGASGIVVEDCARGCFRDNSMSGNASAAVAVQGCAAPVMERNIVIHYGNGGIWLGEKAGGVFTGNIVEESTLGWRIGVEVTATVEAPVTLRSLTKYEKVLCSCCTLRRNCRLLCSFAETKCRLCKASGASDMLP